MAIRRGNKYNPIYLLTGMSMMQICFFAEATFIIITTTAKMRTTIYLRTGSLMCFVYPIKSKDFIVIIIAYLM